MLRQGRDRAALFARAGRVFAWILALASAAIALLAPQIISVLGPGLAAEQHREAVILLRVMAPASFFAGTSALFSALLYTERRFIAPSLYQASLNGATIIAALSLWRAFGVNAFAIGYTSGAAVQLVVTWVVSRDLRSEHFTATRDTTPLKDILLRPAMFLLYATLISGNILVTRAFATHGGPGMAAAFDYCMRCVSVAVAYLVYPVANSLLPEIAHLRGSNNIQQAYRLIDRSVALMAAAAVGIVGVGILLRTPVIALLFERGSFTAESTLLVSGVFLGIAPGILGWALLDLMSRCFFALDRPRLPLAAASIPVTINLAVMSMLGWRGLLGNAEILGLGASAGLMAGFAALYAAAHLRRQKSRLVPETAEV